jgi:simple sugar transport system permease protein
VTRLNFTLQAYGVSIPSQFLAMLPFILTIVVLILLTGGRRGRFLGAPAALTRPYTREQR